MNLHFTEESREVVDLCVFCRMRLASGISRIDATPSSNSARRAHSDSTARDDPNAMKMEDREARGALIGDYRARMTSQVGGHRRPLSLTMHCRRSQSTTVRVSHAVFELRFLQSTSESRFTRTVAMNGLNRRICFSCEQSNGFLPQLHHVDSLR
jgi:hypothetical protein